jgi:hypothetical protein
MSVEVREQFRVVCDKCGDGGEYENSPMDARMNAEDFGGWTTRLLRGEPHSDKDLCPKCIIEAATPLAHLPPSAPPAQEESR